MSYHIITPDPYEGDANRNTASDYLRCTLCNRGELVHKNKYRMNRTIAIIGHILCIPGWLGMLAAVLIFVAAVGGSDHNSFVAGLGTVAAVWIFVTSLISTLLGRLLTMKKWVLECTVCGQEINASKPHGVSATNKEVSNSAPSWTLIVLLVIVIGASLSLIWVQNRRAPTSAPATGSIPAQPRSHTNQQHAREDYGFGPPIWKTYARNMISPDDYFDFDSNSKNIGQGAVGNYREHTVIVFTRHHCGGIVVGEEDVCINCTKKQFMVFDVGAGSESKWDAVDASPAFWSSPIYLLYTHVCEPSASPAAQSSAEPQSGPN